MIACTLLKRTMSQSIGNRILNNAEIAEKKLAQLRTKVLSHQPLIFVTLELLFVKSY